MGRVLVACERSGTIRNAFARAGHDVVSVDTLESTTVCEGESVHVVADALEWLDAPFDLVIARPPCTYLANSGVRWLYKKDAEGNRIDNQERWDDLSDAVDFFNKMKLFNSQRIAIENPIPHSHATEHIGTPSQYVQPWMFGHPEKKATGFWLYNLPELVPTNDVREEMAKLSKAEQNRVHYASPGPDRWMERSKLVEGMAQAMVDQWGSLI